MSIQSILTKAISKESSICCAMNYFVHVELEFMMSLLS